MREICTSGSMRGSDGRGVACNGRPSLSTLLVVLISLVAAIPRCAVRVRLYLGGVRVGNATKFSTVWKSFFHSVENR